MAFLRFRLGSPILKTVHNPGGDDGILGGTIQGIQLLVFGGVYDVNISHADSGEVKARHKQQIWRKWIDGGG